jgi:hypothetical protein
VQALELAAGALNITLLGLSMRNGMALTQWRRKSFPWLLFRLDSSARKK